MKYRRCKCGKLTSWGSMGPQPCEGCEECNTTLALAPDMHKAPIPHEWETETVSRDGKVVREETYCKRCHTKKPKDDTK